MIRYAITDRHLFAGDETAQREALIAQAVRLSQQGVQYLQLREKDLSEGETHKLATAMMEALQTAGGATRLFLNGTASLAQWAGTDGVHLSATNFAQNLQSHHGLIVSASCHTIADVRRAAEFADLILFGPVFEKRVDGEVVVEGVGLEHLREACSASGEIPVLALGGINTENAQACLEVGAAGVAGIRLFQ